MKLNIGTVIRDHRRAANVTQEQLAERLGVTCQSVSRWECGLTYPDIEFLPLLADLFGITLDELMGHTQSAREQRLARLWAEWEALENPDEAFAFLARMREDFPTEWRIPHEMLNLIQMNGVHKEELRPLTMEILENCADADIRWDTTKIFLHSADEEALDREFLDRYTQHASRYDLLESRYYNREDWERHEQLRQYILRAQIHNLFDERLRRNHHASVEDSAWAQETGLSIINLLTDYRPACTADIVDTTPDLWFEDKFFLGMRLSCALASTGKCEDALNVLERVVTLTENTFNLPSGTTLTYRSRALDRIHGKVVKQYAGEEVYRMTLEFEPTEEGARLYPDYVVWSNSYAWYLSYYALTETSGWAWFNPIREHPRFLACIQRMKALDAKLKQQAE